MLLPAVRLLAVFAVGASLGALVNWAAYTFAWNRRPISPWCPTPKGLEPRRTADRLPIIGWFHLRREASLHGAGFWLRPMAIEVLLGVAMAALYWWEVDQLGLIEPQLRNPVVVPWWPVFFQFVSHAILICWMLAASLIDFDEKIIPDEITVTGTLIGLVLATWVPFSLLPHVAESPVMPLVGQAVLNNGGGAAVGPNGGTLWLEPVSPVAPNGWPADWANATSWSALAVAIGCYLLWCFALAPRNWRGRRGPIFAFRLIAVSVWRECCRPPLRTLLIIGLPAICAVWFCLGPSNRVGLITSLIGLVASGGIVWAVRIIGTAALRREAMGFGDVTLMMMIGTFLGWQACLIAFFLAPFAGLLAGIAQFALRRDDVIPYGPFLCFGAAAVIIKWGPIWMWAQPIFATTCLVPAVLVVCLGLLGLMLALWKMVKTALFGTAE